MYVSNILSIKYAGVRLL